MVMQEPLLFSDTLGENIRYGRLEATEVGRHRRRGGGERTRVHFDAEARLRDPHRRARRPPLGWGAATNLDRARVSQGRADPHPRRADGLDRLEDGVAHARCARAADGRPDDVHRRASPVDHRRRGPDPRPQSRCDRRKRDARRTRRAGRPVRTAPRRRRTARGDAARPPRSRPSGCRSSPLRLRTAAKAAGRWRGLRSPISPVRWRTKGRPTGIRPGRWSPPRGRSLRTAPLTGSGSSHLRMAR